MANNANGLNKVKVLVVGDSGVGKTSLVHLLVNGKVLTKSSWTIGCSIEVKVHEYQEGLPGHRPYFVELWDIGGNSSHKAARHLFYGSLHGIILVHDLANRKSQQNLRPWLLEVLQRERGGSSPPVDSIESESFGAFSKVPVLVVGTRLDELAEGRSVVSLPRSASIAEACNATELHVSCLDVRSLAPGSGNAVKVSRFFDKVIDRHLAAEGGGARPFGAQGPYGAQGGAQYVIKMRT